MPKLRILLVISAECRQHTFGPVNASSFNRRFDCSSVVFVSIMDSMATRKKYVGKLCQYRWVIKGQAMTRDLAGLRAVRAVLFDMDGVIYVGNRPLPGVREAIDYLTLTGRRFLFVTNNPSTTSEQFVERLAEMDVAVRPEQVLGSAEATAIWLAEKVADHSRPRGPVIVTGQDALKGVLKKHGFELTTDPSVALYAVASINFKLTYDELASMTLAIRGGAKFIGTNPDPNYPSERGPLPGTGSILALLAAASGRQPLVIGKPNRGMYELAMARLNMTAGQTLMVGDRYETDISGAIQLGLWTAGVLTGISTRGDFELASPPPDLIADNLPDLISRFRWADQH
ncbi:MAG: putative phosphatase [Planctomycetaceae bacterium]|nr:putative phosphatase [Planctomycetaceae bacterium]